jgi:hypothetical protein
MQKGLYLYLLTVSAQISPSSLKGAVTSSVSLSVLFPNKTKKKGISCLHIDRRRRDVIKQQKEERKKFRSHGAVMVRVSVGFTEPIKEKERGSRLFVSLGWFSIE